MIAKIFYSYGVATNEGYCDKLAAAFIKLQQSSPVSATSRYHSQLLYDGANGVGGRQMSVMQPQLADALKLSLHNSGDEGILNYMCGADHVKVSVY